MKYLITGLGNPGAQYLMTRHNIGFMVLDRLVGRENFSPAKYGELYEHKSRGRTYLLLKPNTFMNLSGKAVQHHLKEHKLSPAQMLVITDDLALPFGTTRLRPSGSHGGHNGLRHISEILGTNEFPRLRIGIGDDFHKGKQVDYVLSNFDKHESAWLPDLWDACGKLILDFGFHPIEKLMTEYNKNWVPKPD